MNDILFYAFLLSIVLLGIHSFYGLEIIKRGIIFTDLAIGQMAALGAAISLRFFDGQFTYLIALAFALVTGLAIALVSRRGKDHEAFIGLLYALGISSIFIVLSGSPHGMEEIDKLLAADILFTPRNEILKTSVLYFLLGFSILLAKKKLSGLYYDVFFFVSFALTVTSSVSLAGVLVVFSLLVAPALIASRIWLEGVLWKAWIIGTIINLLAIGLSYKLDYPTGYSIVFCQALSAIMSFVFFNKKQWA